MEPLSQAWYVRFETLLDPEQMPGQKSPHYNWPYVEIDILVVQVVVR